MPWSRTAAVAATDGRRQAEWQQQLDVVPRGPVRHGGSRAGARRSRVLASILTFTALAASRLCSSGLYATADVTLHSSQPRAASSESDSSDPKRASGGLFSSLWHPCAFVGSTCRCVGTVMFSTVLGDPVREVSADGEVQCTAESLGGSSHHDLRICWCLAGVPWGDEVQKGLASLVRQGLTPRIDIASDELEEPGCEPESDGKWHGCVVMSRRWDTTVIPQVLMRAAPPEEQLDMAIKKLDACHRLAPEASLRVLGVRSGQAADTMELPAGNARVCSVVYRPDEGAIWTAPTTALHCATQPGTCTTTPCECRRSSDRKLELRTPQGHRCWACTEPGQEYTFRVNALAEQMAGTSVSWWPPYGINCPPILWMFMDWRAVAADCPVIFGYMVLLFGFLLLRRVEELVGGRIPWTRIAPVFGPALKRGEVWRFFTFTFFHVQFLDLFHNLLTFLDTLDVEGTPAIVLGDGSNLKCGVGAKPNFMCYPSIGMGSYHTLGVALISAMIGGMSSTWVNFRGVVTGANALGFGLSGAIVALYALYAGADLDQSTSVQRSFQDWVWLRLIFVGFHVAMEWIRGVSQKDAAGLFAHTAAFAAGFAYVLYFLPPMGDGTLLSSDRPYIVPCAYDLNEGQFADAAVPDCIRLFSQVYEYQVPAARQNAFLLFAASIGFTVLKTVVLQSRVSSSEAVLLAGLEVSAVCCTQSSGGGHRAAPTGSNLEGSHVIFECEVIKATRLSSTSSSSKGEDGWEASVEVRCLNSDPRQQEGHGLQEEAASSRTRPLPGSATIEWGEGLFLPVEYKKGSFVQLVLWRKGLGSEETALAQAVLTMPQALRFNRRDYSEQWLRLQPMEKGTSRGGTLHVRFQCFQRSDFIKFRSRVQVEVDKHKAKLMELRFLEQQLLALQQMREERPTAALEAPADGASGDTARGAAEEGAAAADASGRD